MSAVLSYGMRLLLATLLGAILGAERSYRHKDAGIRTHSVLALSAALFMILSKYAFFGAQEGADPTMIACQVVMGINFLGAGIIFRSRQVVSHGLTTAAGVWATAAIGMACGCGLFFLAFAFTAMVLGIHLLIHRLNCFGTAYTPQELKITVRNTPEVWTLIEQIRDRYQIQVLSARYKRAGDIITFRMQIQMRRTIPIQDIIHLMDEDKDIQEFSI